MISSENVKLGRPQFKHIQKQKCPLSAAKNCVLFVKNVRFDGKFEF